METPAPEKQDNESAQRPRPVNQEGQDGSVGPFEKSASGASRCDAVERGSNSRERRRNGQCDTERSQNGQDVGGCERTEKRSGESFQKEHRYQREHNDDACVDHSAADFERRVQHDLENS